MKCILNIKVYECLKYTQYPKRQLQQDFLNFWSAINRRVFSSKWGNTPDKHPVMRIFTGITPFTLGNSCSLVHVNP